MSRYGSHLSNSADTVTRWERKALENSQAHNRPIYTAPRTPKSAKRPRTPAGDRFIPSRSNMDLDIARMALTFSNSGENNSASSSMDSQSDVERRMFTAGLQSSVLHGQSPVLFRSSSASLRSDLPGSKILSFTNKAPLAKQGSMNNNKSLYSQNLGGVSKRRNAFRHIPITAEKVLDAPGLQEDFYLNLLDWGSSGALAVALHDAVYLWNATTGSIEHLCDSPSENDFVTSVSWSGNGQYLAVGLNNATVQLWDVNKMTQLRSWRNHVGRVGSMSWKDRTLTTGSADTHIHHNDVRIATPRFATLSGHTQEVCGLKWSPGGRQLASGSNDNTVCIWDGKPETMNPAPKFRLDHHTAAVKAMSWCPLQSNLLATGGGTADQHLRFWNTANGSCVKSVNTNSQVSGIQWSHNEMELVTSHGFAQNQLTVWKYSSLARMADLKGHSQRILHLAQSPEGSTVVSGGADETLRFWKVFENSGNGRRTGRSAARKNGSLTHHQARASIR